MKNQYFLFIIILNLLSTTVWGENFSVNYYHKGVIVHTQQITQGEAIGSLPELNLVSCNNEIPLFAGWITESDANKYQTINTTTPSFITADYTPTADLNLYALFADKEQTNDMAWQQVKSNSELKDNDQIIITANSYNYAIGKTIDKNKRLTAVEITKSNDKLTLTPNDNVQIFTLTKINDFLWEFHCENGYLGNPSTVTNNTITYYTKSNDLSKWSITINTTPYYTQIKNNETDNHPYLYFYEYDNHYFACTTTNYSNLTIYKQKPIFEVNYGLCTTPDIVECTINLHDGNNTSEIKCMSNASINLPEATQTAEHWEFYGWATAPANGSTTTPEIVTSPYTPTGNINLYAVYANTTADSLMMSDKTIPASWQVKETRAYNTVITLYANNNIFIPEIKNITSMEIEMMYTNRNIERTLYITNQAGKELFIQEAYWEYKTHTLSFYQPTSTELNISSSSTKYNDGIAIRKIVIHHLPIYASVIKKDSRHTISFKSNIDNDTTKHYSISQSRGKSVKLPKNTFTNDLDFAFWNTSPDGSGLQYADEATIDNISEDITLYAQWGIIETIDSQETLSIEENTTINKLTIKSDVNGNTGEIKVANNAQLTITNEIIFEKEIDNLRYHFFSLPFDCNITDVEAINENKEKLTYAPNATDGDWVMCRYDQTLAANNAGSSTTNAWIEILDQNYTLKANQGYIVGHFCNYEKVTIKFTSKEKQIISTPKNKTYNFSDYEWYTAGERLSANGWNLIGSPYYETITDGQLTQFVTIPNTDGKTYTQCLYSEALEQRLITPFCSFFVQLNENTAPTITPTSRDYSLLNNYTPNIVTLTIKDNTNKRDHTTIINHSKCNAEYEIGSDLIKWVGYADRPQIYTIENEIPLVFNSQKIKESTTLLLGIYIPTDGEYTFTVNENCPDIYLTDKETNKTTNLAQSNYTTTLSQGTNNERFEICFQKTTSTQLPFNNTKTEYFVENGTVYITNLLQNATMYIYDCTGKMIDITTSNYYTLPSKGLYHIIIIENDRKIDNFDVIY